MSAQHVEDLVTNRALLDQVAELEARIERLMEEAHEKAAWVEHLFRREMAR